MAAMCAELPLLLWCNKSVCMSIAGASELELVGGKGTVCMCKAARYCCKQCQMDYWRQHKAVCNRLLAGAEAAGAKQ